MCCKHNNNRIFIVKEEICGLCLGTVNWIILFLLIRVSKKIEKTVQNKQDVLNLFFTKIEEGGHCNQYHMFNSEICLPFNSLSLRNLLETFISTLYLFFFSFQMSKAWFQSINAGFFGRWAWTRMRWSKDFPMRLDNLPLMRFIKLNIRSVSAVDWLSARSLFRIERTSSH